MSDWEETTLGEACAIEIGGTPSRSEESYWWKSAKDGQALPWVSISDMRERVVSETKESITEIGARNSNCKHVTKGTLLMSFKLTIGKLAFAGKDLYTNEAIAAIRPREGINPEFLYYGLQYWNLTDGTDQAVKGVTLNKQKLQEIRCSIPPLPEQKKIAEILSGIDQLIKCTKEKNAKLKVARDALIQNLREEDTQEWVSLSEMSDFVTSGSRGWSQYYSDKGARFVRIGNLSRHSIDLDPEPQRWQLVEPPKGAEGERTRLQEQDILISITADLGICCIYSSSLGEAYINQHIALVRIDAEHRNYARQVAYYICSEHCQEQIRSMNDSGAKAGLNLDSIRKVQVPLIEGGKGNKFVQSIDSLQDAIMRNACQLQQLAKAKNALSSDLLSGRKRVSV